MILLCIILAIIAVGAVVYAIFTKAQCVKLDTATQKQNEALSNTQQWLMKDIADLEQISISTALGRMRYALINMRKNAVRYNLVRDLEKIFD